MFIKKTIKRSRNLEMQVVHLTNQQHMIANSLSWRITSPLRQAKKILKDSVSNIKKTPTFLYLLFKKSNCQNINIAEITNTHENFIRAKIEDIIPGYNYINVKQYKGDLQLIRIWFSHNKKLDYIWLKLDSSNKTQITYIPQEATNFELETVIPLTKLNSFSLDITSYSEQRYLLNKYISNIKIFKLEYWCKLKESFLWYFTHKFNKKKLENVYDQWVYKYDTISKNDINLINKRIKSFKNSPKFSIIIPCYNTPGKLLRECIDSIRNQLYTNWELCIVDDNSPKKHVKKILQEYEKLDPRIKVVLRETNGHIAEASNSGLSVATGDFVALVDHDDLIPVHALYCFAEELNKNPELDLIYSDEDKLIYDKNRETYRRIHPHFKTDFNHLLLLSQNYICHFTAIRKSIIDKINGFSKEVDGSQDWDIILKAVEQTEPNKIKHIPYILYHWRMIQGSTAADIDFKPYVFKSQRETVKAHLKRIGIEAKTTSHVPTITVRNRFINKNEPKVTIIIPFKDQVKILKKCLSSLLNRTLYENFDILLVNNNSVKPTTFEYLETLKSEPKIKLINCVSPFNYSYINNFAAAQCDSEYLLFMNNDIEVSTCHWLDQMVGFFNFKDIGIVGAKLLYPNEHIQHVGMTLGMSELVDHTYKFQFKNHIGYFGRLACLTEVSAVTGACLLIKNELFKKIDGFNQQNLPVAYNDLDLCLKVRDLGYRIAMSTYSTLYHHESISRGYENKLRDTHRLKIESEYIKSKWGNLLSSDPYYNPNLHLTVPGYEVAFPPRIKKYWED